MSLKADKILNAQGLICPEPMMLLHAAIRDACDGEIIKVLTTDASSERDFNRFCHFLGHTLLHLEKQDDVRVFYIKKCI